MSFRPRDLADRMTRRGDRDGYVRVTFSLPREQARAKAKAFPEIVSEGRLDERGRTVARTAGWRHRIHHAPAENRGLMAAEDEKLEIVPEQAVEVRETRTLFRLAPAADNDLGRPSRQVAIVAADTEEEARQIASMNDAFGRDWRDRRFAVCDAMETSETHVFGDVVFRSEPVRSKQESEWRGGDDMERRRFSLVFTHDRLTLPTHRGFVPDRLGVP